jgi:hypothetical protein
MQHLQQSGAFALVRDIENSGLLARLRDIQDSIPFVRLVREMEELQRTTYLLKGLGRSQAFFER